MIMPWSKKFIQFFFLWSFIRITCIVGASVAPVALLHCCYKDITVNPYVLQDISPLSSRRLSWKANPGRVEFINFSCLKIEQNHSSSCSLPVITYESILGFSYKSSFFMQIRLKTVLLAVLLLKNLAKYNKEINITVKFLLIMFKQSCVIICC